ncbi:Leukocyte receptor cluster member 8 [Candida tropicalis]
MANSNSPNKGGANKGKKKGGGSNGPSKPKVNANLIPLGTRGAATTAPTMTPSNSNPLPSNNMDNIVSKVDFDPSWPPSLQEFHNRSMQRIGKLKPNKQPTGMNQLSQLIIQAKERGVLETNNWSAQLIPILDGGGMFQLDCMRSKKNGGSNGTTPADGSNLQGGALPSSTGPSPPIVPDRFQNNTTNQNKFKKDQKPNKGKDKNQNFKGPKSKFKNGNSNGKRPFVSNFDSEERKRMRLERFGELAKPTTISSFYETKTPNLQIVGTSTNLEKSYMRLTDEAKPENVRPEFILFQSLPLVLRKYRENNDYGYIRDQLKSIRQDLVVQHIKTDFTIIVYEENARISIENNDLSDYNQCAAQLKNLYSTKRRNDPTLKNKYFSHEIEMMLYRLIYLITTKNNSEVNKFYLAIITDFKHFVMTDSEKLIHEFIMALLEVQNHLLQGEFESFFQLSRFNELEETRTAFIFLKNSMLDEIRIRALYSMAYTFASMNLNVVVEKLKFDDGSPKASTHACYNYLCSLRLGDVIDKTKGEMMSAKVRPILKAHVAKFNKVDIKGQR